ncbi:MAG: hypothetical protein KAT43_06135 [Nanoarchaeota archaeon]|nr:hypothetical protein [Nanoarchaeota archaeon]
MKMNNIERLKRKKDRLEILESQIKKLREKLELKEEKAAALRSDLKEVESGARVKIDENQRLLQFFESDGKQ